MECGIPVPKHDPYKHFPNFWSLKDKSGVDNIIAKKQPFQLLNTNREFFPSFDASSFHKLVDESF